MAGIYAQLMCTIGVDDECLQVQDIAVSPACKRGRDDLWSSLASKTVLPSRSGGQYRTTERPTMFFVGSGPLQQQKES